MGTHSVCRPPGALRCVPAADLRVVHVRVQRGRLRSSERGTLYENTPSCYSVTLTDFPAHEPFLALAPRWYTPRWRSLLSLARLERPHRGLHYGQQNGPRLAQISSCCTAFHPPAEAQHRTGARRPFGPSSATSKYALLNAYPPGYLWT